VKSTLLAIALGIAPIAADVDPGLRSRTATISLQKIAAESAEGRAANQQLQALAKKMAGDLQEKQRELQQGQGTAESRQAEMQRLVQQSQVDFTNAQRQAQTELRGKLAPIVSEVATQRQVDVVLNADVAVVWSAPRMDITAEVLSRLNGAPGAAATPPK